jgi:hypothetical protein
MSAVDLTVYDGDSDLIKRRFASCVKKVQINFSDPLPLKGSTQHCCLIAIHILLTANFPNFKADSGILEYIKGRVFADDFPDSPFTLEQYYAVDLTLWEYAINMAGRAQSSIH